jgi:hypothetical protein
VFVSWILLVILHIIILDFGNFGSYENLKLFTDVFQSLSSILVHVAFNLIYYLINLLFYTIVLQKLWKKIAQMLEIFLFFSSLVDLLFVLKDMDFFNIYEESVMKFLPSWMFHGLFEINFPIYLLVH